MGELDVSAIPKSRIFFFCVYVCSWPPLMDFVIDISLLIQSICNWPAITHILITSRQTKSVAWGNSQGLSLVDNFTCPCALTKHHAMKAYWGSGYIAPLIL
jgi:hypothetical protein